MWELQAGEYYVDNLQADGVYCTRPNLAAHVHEELVLKKATWVCPIDVLKNGLCAKHILRKNAPDFSYFSCVHEMHLLEGKESLLIGEEGWKGNVSRFNYVIPPICSLQSIDWAHKIWYKGPPA